MRSPARERCRAIAVAQRLERRCGSPEVLRSVLWSWGYSTGKAGSVHLGMGALYRERGSSENDGSKVGVKAGDEWAEHSEKMAAWGGGGTR